MLGCMPMKDLLLVALLLAALPDRAAAQEVPEDHPVHLDRTGIEWVLPFEAAEARSKRLGRPILMKAVAFGTTRAGCW